MSNDDGVTPTTFPAMNQLLQGFVNPNGCPLPYTQFATARDTVPNLLQQVWMQHNEIASHSASHPTEIHLKTEDEIRSEINFCKAFLTNVGGFPRDTVKGYRSPFLQHNPVQRKILREFGFLYDSSIIEYPSSWSQTSKSPEQKMYPHTWQDGTPFECSRTTGICDENERHPGLWV
jgi:peptidoglycan/xylan/chitin deacetylase (PgdA/CDA1 family)